MQSAYVVLGIPGNASRADIDTAYESALRFFTAERMAEDPLADEKLEDLRSAYKVLSNPELRAAHDRKLSGAAATSVRHAVVVKESSGAGTKIALLAFVGAMAYGGFTVYDNRAKEAERARVAEVQRAEQARLAELAAEERAAQARAREEARREQALRSDSAAAFARSASIQSMQESSQYQRQRLEQMDVRQRENDARNEELNRTREAERSLAMDKQRIRELCYQNYRRYNC